MKFKKPLIFIFVVILLMLLFFIFSKKTTTFYIGIANPSESVNLSLLVDGDTLHNDSIVYNPYKYIIIEKKLSGLFHKLSISINEQNLGVEKNIFLLINQHIIIEYFPNETVNVNKLQISNRITPFYLE